MISSAIGRQIEDNTYVEFVRDGAVGNGAARTRVGVLLVEHNDASGNASAIASREVPVMVGLRLFLPESWTVMILSAWRGPGCRRIDRLL
jgi:hypothetical protein